MTIGPILLLVSLFLPTVVQAQTQEIKPWAIIDFGGSLGQLKTEPIVESVGFEVAGRYRETSYISLAYRYEYLELRRQYALSYEKMTYNELFGSILIPKSFGHSIVVGVARSNLIYDSSRYRHIALPVGLEGRQTIEHYVFDYSARYFINGHDNFELRGAYTWFPEGNNEFGLTTGIQWRRFQLERTSKESLDDLKMVINAKIQLPIKNTP